jgi:hypothetical protein
VENRAGLHLLDGSDDGDLYEQLPRVEALARLYELRERLGQCEALARALTVSERHRQRYGHDLRSGCCREQPSGDSALDVA